MINVPYYTIDILQLYCYLFFLINLAIRNSAQILQNSSFTSSNLKCSEFLYNEFFDEYKSTTRTHTWFL